jgi:hypothetical protein
LSTDPLGKDAGNVSEQSADNLTNSYVTISDTAVSPESDRIQPRQTASGVTRGIQQLGSDKIYSDGGNNRIVVEDTTNPKVLMGNQPTFGEGFYVAKAGVDAATNTDANNWIFNSNQNVFKIISTGTGSVTVGNGDTARDKTTIIPHGLDHVPIVVGFIQNPSGDIQGSIGEVQCPYGIYGLTNTGSFPSVLLPLLQYYYVGADATNIYLVVLSSDVSFYSQLKQTFTFKYYILQETSSAS